MNSLFFRKSFLSHELSFNGLYPDLRPTKYTVRLRSEDNQDGLYPPHFKGGFHNVDVYGPQPVSLK